MNKSTITRERLEEIRDCCWMDDLGLSMCELSELARMALAAMDSEPVRNPVLAYADSYRDMAKQGVESVPIWSVITDLERNIAPLYRHAQQPVVDADDNFYSWFGREWQENYQHNQYTTAAKQMLGVMAESAWKAGRRAAMLQAGNSPVIPEGYVMVPKEPTERMVIDGFESEPDETFSEPEVWEAFQKMSGCEQAAFRARLCWAAMLAAARQEVPDGK